MHSPRKRAGMSSIPPIDADAPNVMGATDFSSTPPSTVKRSRSRHYRRTHRESLLHMVETSISAEHLVTQLETLFAAGGGPPECCSKRQPDPRGPARSNGSSRVPGEYADSD